ncbi:hypothetical protein PMALA_042260 [Plasmodium malariae]|nr:hypothetical protein PMALA_042260 [Plasmodium malariae]
MAIYVQKKSINFQIYTLQINVSISSIISLYTLLRLSCTIFELRNYTDVNGNYENIGFQNMNRSYLKKIRLQRNFWMLLLCSVAWTFYIRFTYLLLYYREKVKRSDNEYEKVLEEKREERIYNKILQSGKVIPKNSNILKEEYNNIVENKYVSSDATTDGNDDSKEMSSVLADDSKKNASIRQRR